VARRGTRFGLLAVIALCLLVGSLAGNRILSSRAQGRAATQPGAETPPSDVPVDAPQGAVAAPASATSDRERALAWAARTSSDVSVDPIGDVLEWSDGDVTWHENALGVPFGEVTAIWAATRWTPRSPSFPMRS